jgi:hypothetical protein
MDMESRAKRQAKGWKWWLARTFAAAGRALAVDLQVGGRADTKAADGVAVAVAGASARHINEVLPPTHPADLPRLLLAEQARAGRPPATLPPDDPKAATLPCDTAAAPREPFRATPPPRAWRRSVRISCWIRRACAEGAELVLGPCERGGRRARAAKAEERGGLGGASAGLGGARAEAWRSSRGKRAPAEPRKHAKEPGQLVWETTVGRGERTSR